MDFRCSQGQVLAATSSWCSG